MTTHSTYRHLLATFLLALYAFIATPVQLWHHHQYPVKVSKTTPSHNAKSDTVANGTDISLETDCAVCSHKYSSYNDEVLTPYEITLPVIAVKNGCYSLQPVTALPASLLNKGPPELF